jgi:2-polyprenyl-3-methyl-5-hydroxy-6-metoxy-1,4-benzoquinol methylase
VNRLVQPEFLDRLPPDDPRAIHSRRDLHRVNAWMGNHRLMAGILQKKFARQPPKQIIELGAGDGNYLLRVAQKITPPWPDVKATLLDLQKNTSEKTLAAFTALNWHAEAIVANVFAWPPMESEVVIANLFLHHFEEPQLGELLQTVSRRAQVFIAIEPRRGQWPWLCSRLLWAIGCNDVTRHDATVSVRAGFSGQELSRLWPDKQDWQLTEQRAGAFSHLFIARKIVPGTPVKP